MNPFRITLHRSTLILALILFSTNIYAQQDSIVEESLNVFEEFPNAKFKLDYYHTDGYSHSDRFWYELIIIDSLLILNFECPQNDDWEFVTYQKQHLLTQEELTQIKRFVAKSKLNQKIPGNPDPLGSGYGANRLIIESDELNIDGGNTYISIGNEQSVKEYNKRINAEKKESTTLSGDYEGLFTYLESLFQALPVLIESKQSTFYDSK